MNKKNLSKFVYTKSSRKKLLNLKIYWLGWSNIIGNSPVLWMSVMSNEPIGRWIFPAPKKARRP